MIKLTSVRIYEDYGLFYYRGYKKHLTESPVSVNRCRWESAIFKTLPIPPGHSFYYPKFITFVMFYEAYIHYKIRKFSSCSTDVTG